MSQPRLARRGGGRYYEIDGERFWSVTTILDALPKPALRYWAPKVVAEWVAANVDAIVPLIRSDPAAAIDTMKNAPWRRTGAKADIGSIVHEVIQAHAMGNPLPAWPEEAEAYLHHFVRFLHDFDPVIEMAEATILNDTYRYAGTLDAIIAIRSAGQTLRLIMDTKTSSGVYPEAALQLAAYRAGELVVMPDGSKVQMPEVDGGAVLWLSPAGYQLVPVRCDPPVFEVFLFAREIWRWQEQTSKRVIGEAVIPDSRGGAGDTQADQAAAPAQAGLGVRPDTASAPDAPPSSEEEVVVAAP